MLHVWFVPSPGGPTAVGATDAQIVHAAEQVGGPHNGSAQCRAGNVLPPPIVGALI
jgi:hypothetical protein